MMNLDCPFELKELTTSGSFSGYAAIFGNVDLGGDVIERGAFKEIVKGRNGRVKILNQHRQADPIGTAEVKQDDKGLAFDGQLILESPSGRSAYALMKGGALDGMSIGYDVLEGGGKILESGIRQLTGLKLWEISPVTFGMNPLAGVDAVKHAGQIATRREFEDFLRDVGGFSKTAAAAIAADGFKGLEIRRDAGNGHVNPDDARALLASISNLRKNG